MLQHGHQRRGGEDPHRRFLDRKHVAVAGDEDRVRVVSQCEEVIVIGVAVVPGSSFFSRPELGSHLVRFAFCKKVETLEEAGARLRKAFA